MEDKNVSYETQMARIKDALQENAPRILEEPECKKCCLKAVEAYKKGVVEERAQDQVARDKSRNSFMLTAIPVTFGIGIPYVFWTSPPVWVVDKILLTCFAILCWYSILSEAWKWLKSKRQKAQAE